MLSSPAPIPCTQVPAFTPGRRNARIVGPADLAGRWVVLGFQARDDRTDAGVVAALCDLAAAHTAEPAAIVVASTASWLETAARHAYDDDLDGRVEHILADHQMRLAAAFGVLGDDGDARRAAFVIDPHGTIREVVSGGLQPVLRAA